LTAPEAIFAALDQAIVQAPPEARPGLVVAIAARLAQLAVGMVPAPPQRAGPPGQAPAEDGLLTYGEAARWLRVSPSYVETLVRQGKLAAVTLPGTDKGAGEHRKARQGRQRRIRLAALRALPCLPP
jgi:excisionase family DNA binding protein